MQKPFSLSGRQLKLIAMVSMLIDHIAVSLVARSSALYTPMRFVGRLAFPLYCLLLVEGFCHTKDRKRYLLSLLGFALISEIPFNMAVAGKIFDLEAQNVFFTLSIGLASLMMADEGKKRGKEWCLAVGYLLIPMLALLLRSDYNLGGVALILVISLTRKRDKWRFLGPALVILSFGHLDSFGALALPLWYLYNGERGRIRYKYAYYAFYPVHLLVLGLIRMML